MPKGASVVRLLRRVLTTLLIAMLGWLTFAPCAHAAVMCPRGAPTYTYDSSRAAVIAHDLVVERAPPAATVCDSVGLRGSSQTRGVLPACWGVGHQSIARSDHLSAREHVSASQPPFDADPSTASMGFPVSAAGFGVAAKEVPDALVLARGGTNTAERFASGSGVTVGADGTLSGVSVNSGKTL